MLSPPPSPPPPPPVLQQSGTSNANIVKSLLSLGIETSTGIFVIIFSFLGEPAGYKRILFRRLCSCFCKALKPTSGMFTIFPHPNYSSMSKLMKKLNRVYKKDPTKAPTIVYVMEGTFHVGKAGNLNSSPRYVVIKYPMNMIGAGSNKTFILGGGFSIQGKQEAGKSVRLTGLTVDDTYGNGLFNHGGLDFLCDRITFTRCGQNGVYAGNTKGRLINCVITQCGENGIFNRDDALIELEGSQTKVHGNGTKRYNHTYGLHTIYSTSTIHLLSPLTKESVSINNHNGHNCNSSSGGTIQAVNSLESMGIN